MGLLNVLAGAASGAGTAIKESLAERQKAMTLQMLQAERDKMENLRQDKSLSAAKSLSEANQKFTTEERLSKQTFETGMDTTKALREEGSERRKTAFETDRLALDAALKKDELAQRKLLQEETNALTERLHKSTQTQQNKQLYVSMLTTTQAALRDTNRTLNGLIREQNRAEAEPLYDKNSKAALELRTQLENSRHEHTDALAAYQSTLKIVEDVVGVKTKAPAAPPSSPPPFVMPKGKVATVPNVLAPPSALPPASKVEGGLLDEMYNRAMQ